MNKAELKLDWCSHAAAKWAVEHWHYSKRCPVGKSVLIGVWESSHFKGVLWFARGANKDMATTFGAGPFEACELVRVALKSHVTPVSQMIAIAIRLLKTQCPLLKLVVSYADQTQGHHGGIYQAGNWLYVGQASPSIEWWHGGRWKHNREMTGGPFGTKRRLATKDMQKRTVIGKHKYLMPLDPAMRAQIEPFRKPYPKRAGSMASDATATQAVEGGATPTSALLLSKAERMTDAGLTPRLE